MHIGVIVRVDLVSVTVERGGRVVFEDLTASLPGPGLYQVIGPNGAGKTTLLLTIVGRIRPSRGRVVVNGRDVRRVKSVEGVVSYMPQHYSIPPDAPITLYEFVESLVKTSSRGLRVEEALELVGIKREHWFKRLSQLSGGLLQRAMLARTLALDTPIVLLDEPFSNIDPEGRVELSEYIGEVSRRKLVITTSHDPILLLDCTEKVLVLGHGNYVFGPADEVLKLEVLNKFYKKCAIELQKHVHIIDWH